MDIVTDANDNMNILDLDLELDLSLNVNVISPMWPENDLNLTDTDTDALLADDLSFGTSVSTASTDFVWDADAPVQGFEDFTPISFSINHDSSNVPVTCKIQIDNSQIQITDSHNSNVFEPWTEPEPGTNTFDVLKDSLFELEVFSEYLKDIDYSAELATCTTMSPIETNAVEADPIIEWNRNRRRSLLYDKNEFVQPEQRQRYERQERRLKASSTASPSPTSTSIDQRTFRCSVRDCDKTYYKASHLKSHMRRHSGVKPFACDWDGCKWRFSRSDELARHKRSHSGIKPYSCDLCDKAFSRSDHLSKHAKVHMKKLALYGTPIITKKCNYKYLTINRIPVE